jgi:hypothetical protein
MKKAFIYFFYYNLLVATLLLIGFFFLNSKVRTLDKSNGELAGAVKSLSEEVSLLRKAQESETGKVYEKIDQIVSKESNNRDNDVLGALTAEGLLPTIDLTDRSAVMGTVTVKTGSWEAVDVYSKPLASSSVTGQAFSGLTYLYTAKENNWYQIELGDEGAAWIQATLVEEN